MKTIVKQYFDSWHKHR